MSGTPELAPLTREEVLKWPSLGPMALDPRRVLAVIAERDLLLEKDPKIRLDGYRELGAKCARLEDELDAAKARNLGYIGEVEGLRHDLEVAEHEREGLFEEQQRLFKIHVSDNTPCHFDQAGGPACVNDAHYRPPTYDDWMVPQREVIRLGEVRDDLCVVMEATGNALTLAKAEAAGAGSLLLDVQRDCIVMTKLAAQLQGRVSDLSGALKDALWVCDHLGDSLNSMDVAGEDPELKTVSERMNSARAIFEEKPEGVLTAPFGTVDRQEFLEEFLAELCEHIGTVVEPELVTKIRNFFTPKAWDPDHDQDQRCVCGHSYYRHFDSHEEMDPVGCKYCGADCEMFRPATSPCPRCDDDGRGVLLAPNVWTACPACKRGGSST